MTNFRDVEKLSAYIDGQLKPSEIARLESRLKTDPELASVLEELRQTRGVLRKLPSRRAPRNFTLTPKMVGQKPPLPRTYSIFQFATVAATVLLLFTFATNAIASRLAMQAAAPMAFGMGGGGGAEPEVVIEEAPAMEAAPAEPAVEEPSTPQAEMAVPAPTQGGTLAEDSSRVEPTSEPALKNGEPGQPPAESEAEQEKPADPAAPVSAAWQVGLAILALGSAFVLMFMRKNAASRWRKRT